MGLREVGYVGEVELVEFRWRFLCGAWGALVAAVRQREKAREKAAVRQRRGVGGAETTGSLRAFSRGTPRTIDAR